ncbi:hypothetical protein QJQ45_002585 [Haematococcus lacustris]|nr:hypothetical protein QJQ45_002585 [Haematococcus lacustris]
MDSALDLVENTSVLHTPRHEAPSGVKAVRFRRRRERNWVGTTYGVTSAPASNDEDDDPVAWLIGRSKSAGNNKLPPTIQPGHSSSQPGTPSPLARPAAAPTPGCVQGPASLLPSDPRMPSLVASPSQPSGVDGRRASQCGAMLDIRLQRAKSQHSPSTTATSPLPIGSTGPHTGHGSLSGVLHRPVSSSELPDWLLPSVPPHRSPGNSSATAAAAAAGSPPQGPGADALLPVLHMPARFNRGVEPHGSPCLFTSLSASHAQPAAALSPPPDLVAARGSCPDSPGRLSYSRCQALAAGRLSSGGGWEPGSRASSQGLGLGLAKSSEGMSEEAVASYEQRKGYEGMLGSSSADVGVESFMDEAVSSAVRSHLEDGEGCGGVVGCVRLRPLQHLSPGPSQLPSPGPGASRWHHAQVSTLLSRRAGRQQQSVDEVNGADACSQSQGAPSPGSMAVGAAGVGCEGWSRDLGLLPPPRSPGPPPDWLSVAQAGGRVVECGADEDPLSPVADPSDSSSSRPEGQRRHHAMGVAVAAAVGLSRFRRVSQLARGDVAPSAASAGAAAAQAAVREAEAKDSVLQQLLALQDNVRAGVAATAAAGSTVAGAHGSTAPAGAAWQQVGSLVPSPPHYQASPSPGPARGRRRSVLWDTAVPPVNSPLTSSAPTCGPSAGEGSEASKGPGFESSGVQAGGGGMAAVPHLDLAGTGLTEPRPTAGARPRRTSLLMTYHQEAEAAGGAGPWAGAGAVHVPIGSPLPSKYYSETAALAAAAGLLAPVGGAAASTGLTDATDAAQPSPAQPSPAQPSPAQPSPAQPSPAQPSPAQPSPAQPSPAQPSPAQPSPAQPSPAQPSPAQPSPAQPSPAQPSPAQPSPAQPSPAQPYSPTLHFLLSYDAGRFATAVAEGLGVCRAVQHLGLREACPFASIQQWPPACTDLLATNYPSLTQLSLSCLTLPAPALHGLLSHPQLSQRLRQLSLDGVTLVQGDSTWEDTMFEGSQLEQLSLAGVFTLPCLAPLALYLVRFSLHLHGQTSLTAALATLRPPPQLRVLEFEGPDMQFDLVSRRSRCL